MTQFSDFPALDQPEHRLGILAMLPEDAILAMVRSASHEQDLAWLEPMIHGGLLDVDGIRDEPGKASIAYAFAWQKRVLALVEFLKCIDFESLEHDDLLGALSPPVPVLVCRVRPDAKALFRRAIERTVLALDAIKDKHPHWRIPQSSRSIDCIVDGGMALLLCAAVAMDLPESVQVIVDAYPDSVWVQVSLSTFGNAFSMGAPSGINASKEERGSINSAGLAIRLSRRTCLDRLLENRLEALQELGVQKHKSAEYLFNLSGMPAFLTPNCTPAMWAHATAIYFRQVGPWEKEASGKIARENNAKPDAIAFKKMFAPLIDQPLCKMLTNHPLDPMLPYIAAMTVNGVYDFDPDQMLPVALTTGHPDLVVRLVTKVSDWSLVKRLCLERRSLISEVALNARCKAYWKRHAQYEASILAFFRGAPAHIQAMGFSCQLEQDPYEHNKTVLRLEPFYSMAMAGFQKAVALYVAHGFDPHQTCPSEAGAEQTDTVLDQIERVDPSMADFIRSCSARNRSFDLLDEIEHSTSCVSST